MRREDIDTEFQEVSFNFFYWFSRFEFCLKEHSYRKTPRGNPIRVEVCWDKFIDKFHGDYKNSAWQAAADLKTLSPKK